MPIIEDLCDDAVWDEFMCSASEKVKSPADRMRLVSFVMNREYRPMVDAIARGDYVFSDPVMKEVPKSDGSMRRVYSFKGASYGEHMVLRVINRLLSRYQRLFAPNLYSESKNHGVEGTVFDLLAVKDVQDRYFFKFDISDYGNSIIPEKLIGIMRSKLDACDMGVADLLEGIITNPNVQVMREIDGKKKMVKESVERKGAMPGIPVATFFFSIYLSDMDWHFHDLGVPYFRFNDDILVIARTEEDVLAYKDWVISYITEFGLSTNEKKMKLVGPNEAFNYLGLSVEGGEIAITDDIVRRKRSQIKARAVRLNRMAIDRAISRETAADRLIDYLYRSFYDPGSQFSFSRIYFSRITCSRRLADIDSYAQDCIRYVCTGRFRDSNRIRMPYSALAERGYVPLVSAYRMFREETRARHSAGCGRTPYGGDQGTGSGEADDVVL